MKTTKSRWIILFLIQASLLLIHYSNCDDDNQEDSSTDSVLNDLEMSNNTTDENRSFDESYSYSKHPVAPIYTATSPAVDFTPLFLALIPIALFLGAAAAFALSTAATSSQAVATASQQQQQQEASNNNNAANNNNNALLTAALLSSTNNNKKDSHFPYFIFTNGTYPFFFNGSNFIGRSLKMSKRFKFRSHR